MVVERGVWPRARCQLSHYVDDIISVEYLSKCDGTNPDYPTYVAIKGTVFDVTGNKAYGPEGSYKVFAGKDASRALAQSSLKPEECRPEWEDLSDEHKKLRGINVFKLTSTIMITNSRTGTTQYIKHSLGMSDNANLMQPITHHQDKIGEFVKS
ncbi:hypothetical protein KC357_g171 [Hortaea werneckii]|nr:hypothetical protein KC357_g171 [Hortaea werneckii]